MGTIPRETPPQRFRLPVRQPLRELLIASLCATIGSLEIIAWATFRLGEPLLIAGIVLILVGLSYGLWCLVRHWRTRWVAKVDAEALTVTNGSRRRRLLWSEIGAVEVGKNQVEIFDRHRKKQLTLGVDRTPRAHESMRSMLDAIAVQQARHDS
jgi:hypothetical protein